MCRMVARMYRRTLHLEAVSLGDREPLTEPVALEITTRQVIHLRSNESSIPVEAAARPSTEDLQRLRSSSVVGLDSLRLALLWVFGLNRTAQERQARLSLTTISRLVVRWMYLQRCVGVQVDCACVLQGVHSLGLGLLELGTRSLTGACCFGGEYDLSRIYSGCWLRGPAVLYRCTRYLEGGVNCCGIMCTGHGAWFSVEPAQRLAPGLHP